MGARVSTFESRKLAHIVETLRLSGAPGRASSPIAGLFWVTCAMLAFAGLGAFAKYATQNGMHPFQVIFIRNTMCVLLLLPMVAMRGRSLFVSSRPGLYATRILLAFISMMAWFMALSTIPYVELTAISFLAPLFGTLFAVLYLGEVVRARRWTALAIGFIGAMIILRPGGSPFGAGQMFAIIAALTSGIIGPLLKQMTNEDDADKIVFLSNLGLVPLSLIPALFVWQWPAAHLLPALLGLGLCAVVGHICLLRGFASTDASLVCTFEFSRLPFVAMVGWIWFREEPDLLTLVGALIIFASAAYITQREAQLKHTDTRIRDVSDPLMLTPVRIRFSE